MQKHVPFGAETHIVQLKNPATLDVQTLQLNLRLQHFSEPEQMLDYFFNSLRNSFDLNGYAFENNGVKFQRSSLKQGSFSIDLQLLHEDEAIGLLQFSRQKKFRQEEIDAIVTQTHALLLPLRTLLRLHGTRQLAFIDPLTGAASRCAFTHEFEDAIHHAEHNADQFCVLIIDIDNFKRINDAFGHLIGDKVLKKISSIFLDNLRKGDRVYRIGGEEFFVLLPHTELEDTHHFAERIRNTISQTAYKHNNLLIKCTVSIGIADYMTGDTIHCLFERADLALYRAKAAGGNTIRNGD